MIDFEEFVKLLTGADSVSEAITGKKEQVEEEREEEEGEEEGDEPQEEEEG